MVYLENFLYGKKNTINSTTVGNKLVAGFKEKARLFNKVFASKCTPTINDSSVPKLVVLNLESSLSAINFKNDCILKIIRSFNINKAHDHGNILIRMIKLCNKAIVKPLYMSCKNCINSSY